MAATESTMVSLGTKAKNFSLKDVRNNSIVSLEDYSEQALVLMFVCNHCPYVIHIHEAIIKLVAEYEDNNNISFIAISSNDVDNYPDDSPEKMKEKAEKYNYSFPYLYDESQEMAREYDAVCTPDFFVFDKNKELFYRGQFDDSRPKNNKEINGKDLKNAINSLLNNKKATEPQIPSIGCNIKWKK
jgi:peroxiredoxin